MKDIKGLTWEETFRKTKERIKDLYNEGLKQIEDKKYYMELEKREIKEMTFLGLAFYKKLLKIKYKEYKKSLS